jgi:hypothetical protein
VLEGTHDGGMFERVRSIKLLLEGLNLRLMLSGLKLIITMKSQRLT